MCPLLRHWAVRWYELVRRGVKKTSSNPHAMNGWWALALNVLVYRPQNSLSTDVTATKMHDPCEAAWHERKKDVPPHRSGKDICVKNNDPGKNSG